MNRSIESAILFQAALKQYCLFLTRNRWEAEDLAQETWLKALPGLKTNNHSNPRALLFQIAKNTWVDHCRRLKLFRRYLELEKNGSVNDHKLGDGHLGMHLEVIFQALITHLTPLQRAVLVLKDVYDYSIIETANILKMGQGAVKAALHRARKSLEGVRQELEQNAPSSPGDSSHRTLLRSLAAACDRGDVARVLELLVHNEVEPESALVIAYDQILANRGATISDSLNGIRLSAAA